MLHIKIDDTIRNYNITQKTIVTYVIEHVANLK